VEADDVEKGPIPVSNGPIDRVVDYMFNASRDKIREMTTINPMQAKLLPQLDIIDMMWQYAIEIAQYRQDKNVYKQLYKREQPIPPNIISEFSYRTAQWQKSLDGRNMKAAENITLAEVETKNGEEGAVGSPAFED
jgi:hypothetical protein